MTTSSIVAGSILSLTTSFLQFCTTLQLGLRHVVHVGHFGLKMHGGFEQARHFMCPLMLLCTNCECENASDVFCNLQSTHVMSKQPWHAKCLTSCRFTGRMFEFNVCIAFLQPLVLQRWSRHRVHVLHPGCTHGGFEQSIHRLCFFFLVSYMALLEKLSFGLSRSQMSHLMIAQPWHIKSWTSVNDFGRSLNCSDSIGCLHFCCYTMGLYMWDTFYSAVSLCM